MIRLLRDQIIDLALKPETELGVQHVLVKVKDGESFNAFVHDFEYLDTDKSVSPKDITHIEVLNY